MIFDHTDESTAIVVMAGSHAYGTNTPESDIDLRGVCVTDPWIQISRYVGFDQDEHPNFDQAPSVKRSIEEKTGQLNDLDFTIYDVGKAIKLIGDCNPNMLEIPFTAEEDIVYCNKYGQMILEHKDLFITLRAKHRYVGYAQSQLAKIKRHRGWLLQEDTITRPKREDFGLPTDASLLPEKEKNLINEQIQKILGDWGVENLEMHSADRDILREKMRDFWGTRLNCSDEDLNFKLEDLAALRLGLKAEVRSALDRERKFRAALKHYKSYLAWKNERNEKRKKLEADFGFDTKHAMHLIRLMRTGVEILSTGKLNVKRDDAEDLLDIRRGKREYEDIVEEANKLEEKMDELYILNPMKLPKKADTKKLDDLHKQIVYEYARQ